jgi:hypothetical protein
VSVEFEVRLGVRTVPKAQLFRDLSAAVRSAILVDSVPSWETGLDSDDVIGSGDDTFRLELGPDAVIQCRCYTVGPEDAFGEDGGWWVCFSVVLRTPESFLLMIFASACLGQVAGTQVLDDSGFFGRGRWLKPADLLAVVATSARLPFADAARLVCASLGVSFESGGDLPDGSALTT